MQIEKSDEQLQRDVQDHLRREPGLDVADIGVTVERGIVILDGQTPSVAQRQLVEDVVRGVTGVRTVVDDLDVRPRGTPINDDVRVAREALDALDRVAGAPGDRVQVVVHDGRVRLEGTVASPGERAAAEAAVGDVVLGWGSVENMIAVRSRADLRLSDWSAEGGPRGEDDFDTLRIDPRPGNAEGGGMQHRHPHPRVQGAGSRASAGRVGWLDE